MKTDELREICSLKQVVNVPTRKTATLDLIMTNIDNLMYKFPTTLPSIAKSDHLCVLYVPKKYTKQVAKKETIMIRKFNPASVWLVKISIIIDRSVLRGKVSPLSPVYSGHSISVHKARLLYEYFRPTPQG